MPDDPATRYKRDAPRRNGSPQSSSGRGHRSSVPNRRILRSPRLGAGQVRDASSRKSGQAVGEPIRFGIRLLAPHVLSSGRVFSTRRSVGAIAWQARTPSGPQTYSRGSGLRYPTPGERSSHLDLAAAIQKRFAITAHPRSIERARGRQEKKRY